LTLTVNGLHDIPDIREKCHFLRWVSFKFACKGSERPGQGVS